MDFTLSDFCYKQPGVQERGGIYYFPNKEVGITATSICVYKDAYGQYESKGKLKNGKRDGKWTIWIENGHKFREFNFKDGKQDGKFTQWRENGQKWKVRNYIDDKKDGKWTSWYENGQKWTEFYFKNDKQEGLYIYWHENGQIEAEAIYKDGECISGDCDYFKKDL